MTQNIQRIKIEDIPILCQPHCIIKDKEYVERVLNELIHGGVQKLQVVSDFDYTITKQRLDDGEPVLTSFGMFNACKSLPPKFLEEALKLNKKYRPIEIDPKIPHDEKIKSMIEWWTKSGELMKGFPLSQEELDEVTYHYRHSLRDGTKDLFEKLFHHNVPLLVFSAGLGNSVVSILKHANILYPNVKVVSNFLQYKDDNILNGFQNGIIHTFNKNESVLKGTEYYNMVHHHDHVLLMGDSLGDAGMADGVPKSSHILKIGFLFDHVEDNMERYMNTFDIVLVDDQTMQVPQAIVNLIAK